MVKRYRVEYGRYSIEYHEDPNGPFVGYADHEAALTAKDEEIARLRNKLDASKIGAAHRYTALLDQTIQFAEMAQSDMITEGSMKQAKAFLARPDVQARRKET